MIEVGRFGENSIKFQKFGSVYDKQLNCVSELEIGVNFIHLMTEKEKWELNSDNKKCPWCKHGKNVTIYKF